MKMDLIEGSETSAVINQTPGNYPKQNLLYSVHGESLESGFITLTNALLELINLAGFIEMQIYAVLTIS
jgi:flagellar basal body rod protein FlgF